MSKQTKQTSGTGSAFVGSYVKDYAKALIASAASGVHLIAIGAPGEGKTAIARATASALSGDRFAFTRFDPSSPKDKIEGTVDFEAYLRESKLSYKVQNTPYDPNAKIWIADELFRANDITFDKALDPFDRYDVDPDSCPVIWSTANFIAKGNRVEALIDRIGLWVYLNPDPADVRAIAIAQMTSANNSLRLPIDVPDWKDIQAARAAKPDVKTAEAVADFLEELATIATREGRKINRRRVDQWRKIAYRVTALYKGSATFSDVADEAKKILAFAYPTADAADAADWKRIAGEVIDTLGTAIEGVLVNARADFNEIAKIKDPATRAAKLPELGKKLADYSSNLQAFGKADDRVADAIQDLSKWYASAATGKAIAE